jgi:hypothetical protein
MYNTKHRQAKGVKQINEMTWEEKYVQVVDIKLTQEKGGLKLFY